MLSHSLGPPAHPPGTTSPPPLTGHWRPGFTPNPEAHGTSYAIVGATLPHKPAPQLSPGSLSVSLKHEAGGGDGRQMHPGPGHKTAEGGD